MRVLTVIRSAVSLGLGAFGCSGSGGGGPTGPPAPQTSVVVTLPSSRLTSRQPVQAVATLVTGATSVPASNVHWSSDNTPVASVDGNGLITGEHVGSARISASSDGKTGIAQVTVIAGAPAAVVVYIGNNQVGTAGSALPDPLCTNVTDAAGNLIIGAPVTYDVATGGGQILNPSTVPTDGSGIARSGAWVLGPTAGPQTVIATASGATSTVFTATAR